MVSVTGEIWVICGNSCAGKTTTARLLARQFPVAAHIEGDEMQRLIVSGSRWAVLDDRDPRTGHLRGAAGLQYVLRLRNACRVAAECADAGVTAVVSDTFINEGFDAMTDVLIGRTIRFVVLRPDVSVLRERGAARLPEEAAYLAQRYPSPDHPEAKELAEKFRAVAEGRPTNEFEEAVEWGLDRLPQVGMSLDSTALSPLEVVERLLADRGTATWTVGRDFGKD